MSLAPRRNKTMSTIAEAADSRTYELKKRLDELETRHAARLDELEKERRPPFYPSPAGGETARSDGSPIAHLAGRMHANIRKDEREMRGSSYKYK